jgi:hypothetical protein
MPAAAARELVGRLDTAELATESFAFETTLASRGYLPHLTPVWRARCESSLQPGRRGVFLRAR